MKNTYEALMFHLDELHRGLREALDDLPAEALDWVPGPDMNSLAVLIFHLTGAERYWIGDVIMGDPSFRDRDAEFRVKGLTADALRQRLNDLETYEHRALEQLGLADLEEERVSPRDGSKRTVAYAVAHALSHTGVHVGHVEILRQIWHQQHASAPSA